MSIQYELFDGDHVKPEELSGFFEGWINPPTPEKHHQILAGSYMVLLARDEDTSRIVGFINAISDGVLSCFIPLLEVLPEYRGKGIGKELVSRLVERLDNFRMVDLCCDEELRGYYETLGFMPGRGMIRRNIDSS